MSVQLCRFEAEAVTQRSSRPTRNVPPIKLPSGYLIYVLEISHSVEISKKQLKWKIPAKIPSVGLDPPLRAGANYRIVFRSLEIGQNVLGYGLRNFSIYTGERLAVLVC